MGFGQQPIVFGGYISSMQGRMCGRDGGHENSSA